ncbi:MAG: ECF transporter S component [Ruminococcus sp.]|nr:ECF transporter S component [Ruminococcus sp.]
MHKDKLSVMTQAAMFTALTVVATLIIQIPSPTKGYVNLGDSIINIGAWLLGPLYGAAAAGIGSAIADIISGFVVYAPVTLFVKAAMAVVSALVIRTAGRHSGALLPRIAAAAAAETVMIVGYALFEAVLYHSFSAALLGVPANVVQGAFGAVISVAAYELVIKRALGKNRK